MWKDLGNSIAISLLFKKIENKIQSIPLLKTENIYQFRNQCTCFLEIGMASKWKETNGFVGIYSDSNTLFLDVGMVVRIFLVYKYLQSVILVFCIYILYLIKNFLRSPII